MTDLYNATTGPIDGLNSDISIADIAATLKKFPKLPDWQILEGAWIPKTSRVWIPPTDPFIEYEESDHDWLKKLGFGIYEERPVVYVMDMNVLRDSMCDFKWSSP